MEEIIINESIELRVFAHISFFFLQKFLTNINVNQLFRRFFWFFTLLFKQYYDCNPESSEIVQPYKRSAGKATKNRYTVKNWLSSSVLRCYSSPFHTYIICWIEYNEANNNQRKEYDQQYCPCKLLAFCPSYSSISIF